MFTMRFMVMVFSVTMMLLGSSLVFGQAYPTRPVTLRSTEAGGVLDFAARVIAQEITGPLGQPVIVENVPSALAGDGLTRAKPDGYTMHLGAGTIWLTQITEKTTYDARTFVPVSLVQTYPHLLVVHSSLPVKSVKELIGLAKARPGDLNIAGSASPGGQSRLGAELFKAMGRLNIVVIPFKGNQQALVAVLSGEVHMMFIDAGSVIPQVKAGKLRSLAVTSLQPVSYAPGVPTMSASGLPGFESILIAGVLAPAGTPPPIVNRVSQEIIRALNKPEVKAKFPYADVAGSTPEQFAEKIKSEIGKWSKVLKDAGIPILSQ